MGPSKAPATCAPVSLVAVVRDEQLAIDEPNIGFHAAKPHSSASSKGACVRSRCGREACQSGLGAFPSAMDLPVGLQCGRSPD